MFDREINTSLLDDRPHPANTDLPGCPNCKRHKTMHNTPLDYNGRPKNRLYFCPVCFNEW